MKSILDSLYFMRRFPLAKAALLLAIATHSIALIAQTRPAANTILVDDTFADGNSQNQDLTANSMWLFNGRTTNIRTDKVGSVDFDVTPNGGSSEGFWAFFTKSGAPVNLGVGDKLSVAVTFSLNGFQNNGQDIRWGVFDSLGTRNTANLGGGMNDATFINDPGYGLDFYASGAGSPFLIGRRAVLSNANVFNNFGDFSPINGTGATERQALKDDVLYTLIHTIERLTSSTTRITAAVTGEGITALNYAATENNPSPLTNFDYFGFRISGTAFTTKITFTELLVQYLPAAPVITSQPQPSRLILQVGSPTTLAFGASGSQLSFQWLLNGKPLTGNLSAQTPTLNLAAVTLADAGSYTAVVSNAGGSVTSNAVTLAVSETPVPPPPVIRQQPVNTTVTFGSGTTLMVNATGDGLFYQWFKDEVLIAGATESSLIVRNAQIADAGSYTVVVSSATGSVRSNVASLVVVSAMTATRVAPNAVSSVCIDTPLQLQFDQTPSIGRSGRIIITNSGGVQVDSIDMATSPQTKLIGGTSYVYFPIIIRGNTAFIYLHRPLPVNDSYFVTISPGVLNDATGAPFRGIDDTTRWSFTTRVDTLTSKDTAFTVAADGRGDFCMVQTAIDLVPAANSRLVTITVRPGTYNEINYVPSNKPFITVRGEDRDNTIIQYSNNANVNAGNSRAMFSVDAPDFTLENITLYNTTLRGGSQAEAFRGNNSRILLNRVTLKSFQDTLLLQGQAMVANSYIEGDVDFMWGAGAVYFINSELKAVTSGGYYTQIRNTSGLNGNVYVNCRLTSADGVTGVYLSRIDPIVFPFSQVVYLNTVMGTHIIPSGWLLNNATTAPNVQFWEYRSVDTKGTAIDVSTRLPFARQLTATEAVKWSDPGTTLNNWVPYTVFSGTTIDWTAPPSHSAKDWVGLYISGTPDTDYLAWQYTGSGTTGSLRFQIPSRPGQYEYRHFLNDGFTRVAISNTVLVK